MLELLSTLNVITMPWLKLLTLVVFLFLIAGPSSSFLMKLLSKSNTLTTKGVIAQTFWPKKEILSVTLFEFFYVFKSYFL